MIRKVLTDIVENGIDKKAVEAGINYMEFRYREADFSSYPKGLMSVSYTHLLLANQGLLDIRICFFIIMGCNIGSCVSALLAGLSGKREAKRAALIHLVFNIIGTFIIYVILSVAPVSYTHRDGYKRQGKTTGWSWKK